ncbi:B3 domain-containing transcription repressor VAL2-like isoform X1 [Cynara cardunculus var. scolymus]|uniref:B3 domain-containing transcription repressor VAL2-like isoform X1 n=2 Tax=Cynara cardunculus var. scolymus TaxID=59895 RepID=UPI000D62B132|nr:B3 domain-containing transcription repressor VAL2-like isoform X1 [Cynara cardunculus var. scolymus]XP_024981189.1 B3 domain-containing transcription repressor VAL2-like isoform X1 [Cynara cardunculus var. scolymus]
MESRICMNELCGASLAAAGDYKKGWALRSGDFAKLCNKCGIAYEKLAFCELFHLVDTGWRECTSCGKRLHCGCIASSAFIELLEDGGVSCASCSNSLRREPSTSEDKPEECGVSVENSVGEMRSSSIKMLKQCGDGTGDDGQKYFLPSDNDDASTSQMKQEESLPPKGEMQTMSPSISTFNGTSESAHGTKVIKYKESTGVKDAYGSLVQTDLTIGLASSRNPVFLPSMAVEERELNKSYSSFQHGPWSRHVLPKVPKSILAQGYDGNASMNSQIRVARPPVEGRIKNQLLPRYWPRITEQELQQISGDSNATVVPLFEKVLSASDAGRIGRLVLPKACAEAYFPPISQPEGLPLRIQDVKGKEWLFQFRFWPNNNSRMYVLEGVTPCIQSMQLKAGDTVTFSRMEPEGKLLMGFRKAPISASMQDSRIAAIHSGVFPSEPSLSGVNTIGNLSHMSDYSGLLQSLKRNTDSHLNALSTNTNSPIGDASRHANEKLGSKSSVDSFQPDKKRSRNINSKSKRLLIESQDALELKYTWEELQDMLSPPTALKPSTITIEDHEFEEYEEPPVFGKVSIFTARLSGEQEQWAQCNNCSKWRRLPVNFLLPAKWTCQENVWDQSRSVCLAPDELSPRELEYLLGLAKEFQRLRRPDQAQGVTGHNLTEPSIAATTKHPRHRPGCSCIVCSQPPSGKGKHKPNCTCNVCMTVKRRFKTLMLRKQQRQSEREAEIAEKNQLKLETEMETGFAELRSSGKGQLDLNIHPRRLQDNHAKNHVSMMSLLQAANQPLETYMKQKGLTSLISEPQASSVTQPLPQDTPTVQADAQCNEEERQGLDENQNSS